MQHDYSDPWQGYLERDAERRWQESMRRMHLLWARIIIREWRESGLIVRAKAGAVLVSPRSKVSEQVASLVTRLKSYILANLEAETQESRRDAC